MNASNGRAYDSLVVVGIMWSGVTMSPNQFRLVLAISALIAALAYLASVDPVLMVLVVLLAMIAGALWMVSRVVRWAWRRSR